MPSPNVYKVDIAETFYHVYARGASKQKIFIESSDYYYFLGLFQRYLSLKPKLSKTGIIYPHYRGSVEILCYCLMSNHFHLVIYQKDQGVMKKLMHSIMTSYSRYFNIKYKRSGPLFETQYKASRIDKDNYLTHISRYIHLNPHLWRNYRYSSLKYYLGDKSPDWLQTEKVTELFDGVGDDYLKFVSDYQENKQMIDQLKHELANG